MTPRELLIDTFMYFARFPELAAVQKELFTTGVGNSIIAGYDTFKTKVDDLATADNSLCPEIKHYLFAPSHGRVKKRITNIGDYYLMIDYGQIQKQQNQYNVVSTSFFIAITVARPITAEDTDDAEEILVSQECFRLLDKIYTSARADKSCPIMKFDFTGGYMPFEAPVLDNSIGWTLELTREGNLQTH